MPQKYLPLKVFGFETQAPRWVLTLLALVLVAGVGITVYRTVYMDPDRAIVSLRDANKQLAAEVEEYSLHAMEEPQKHELFEDQDGRLMLRVYKDHCVLIQRQSPLKGTRTKLVVDLARASSLIASRQQNPPMSLLPVVSAQQGCSRGCMNPHPGPFTWYYGAKTSGGWVEVWRRWPEGCQHVQMFHPQSGAWDSNNDGSARVRWTCCVH
jgi:hypothetical protein